LIVLNFKHGEREAKSKKRIWAQYPPSTSGAGSTVFAGDAANGSARPQIQASTCEQDLADQRLQVSKELVHNDDRMTNVGGNMKLEKCEGGKWPTLSQRERRAPHRQALRGRGLRPDAEGSGPVWPPLE
jgi:hypothetical protein